MRRRHVVVFARQPRLGRVKRRLAAGVGAAAALRFYRSTLTTLLGRIARDGRWTVWLAATPDVAASPRGWPQSVARVPIRPQGDGDLGARMARALRVLPPGPAVIVGSDIPDIDAARIAAAFRELGRHAYVFGPAEDGGYWLVGARRTAALPAGLFRGVRWSTEHALADTLASLPQGASIGFLDRLADIDDAAALARHTATLTKT